MLGAVPTAADPRWSPNPDAGREPLARAWVARYKTPGNGRQVILGLEWASDGKLHRVFAIARKDSTLRLLFVKSAIH
jgi:hypothetical protein